MPALVINYTLQDIISASLAVALFPLVLVFPGYMVAWGLDAFSFRNRIPAVQLVIAVVTSFAVSPVLFFLAARFLSMSFALNVLGLIALGFMILVIKQRFRFRQALAGQQPMAVAGLAWASIAILSLVDLNWDRQLYSSVISYDLTTRVSLVDAITRTGIPPVNPGFYPGGPVHINRLYYFWYVLVSLIDLVGGKWVDARSAQIASSVWCGLGLMAAIVLYLRLRAPGRQPFLMRRAWIGIGLLLVSGLDLLPAGLSMSAARALVGDIEHWNTQITAWVGSVLWTPHHVAALVACLSAFMIALDAQTKPILYRICAGILAGVALASALGLSLWVTLIFAVFWGLWTLILLFRLPPSTYLTTMILAASTGFLAALPFLLPMALAPGSWKGAFPLSFEIRSFYPVGALTETWPEFWRGFAMLASLPLSYFLELGFFFAVGIIWFRLIIQGRQTSNQFYRAEMLLLAVASVCASLFRSNVLWNNDFGWRAWLGGQFVLLVWAVDVVEYYIRLAASSPAGLRDLPATIGRAGRMLLILLLMGIGTSILDLFSLRLTGPFNAGVEAGQDQYSARLAYDFLRERIPADVITQSNPLDSLDRPSGLYGTHQMVIADRTPYDVPADVYETLMNDVGDIFTSPAVRDWSSVDAVCNRYAIDLLIIKDTDPIWKSSEQFEPRRSLLYGNKDYRIVLCGDYKGP